MGLCTEFFAELPVVGLAAGIRSNNFETRSPTILREQTFVTRHFRQFRDSEFEVPSPSNPTSSRKPQYSGRRLLDDKISGRIDRQVFYSQSKFFFVIISAQHLEFLLV